MSILISIFLSGYHGKTTDFAKNSFCHRTTIAHFLNSGKWDESLLSDTLKQSVLEIIYSEAARTGKSVFCIVDDTIASKTKPSSRVLHPIEDAYFHQSHLKGKQDYGHQSVSVMLSCNGIVLNYALGQFTRNYTQTVKRAADNKRRYAPGEGSIPPVLLSGVSKGAPLWHTTLLAKCSVLYALSALLRK
ncbi:hypothetical protein [Lacrimispora indolis]|uniref:hypothetical protein n=1 Tax=Lacrimispora indolis TaxID=69825 RepID=UPI003562FAD6